MRSHLGVFLSSMLAVAFATSAPAQVGSAGDSTAYHIYPSASVRARSPSPGDRAVNDAQTMLYYGGPVIANVRIVSVIWGPNVNRTTAARIGPFLGAVVNSTYIDQLAQYATNRTAVNGQAGTNQKIGRGAYRGQFMIMPKNASPSLTDAAIQTEIRQQIAAGKLPAADLNTLYMIYFPFNVTITSFGKSCVAFAAYHSSSSGAVSTSNLFYGVMPDCGGGFADMTISSSHEIAEAVTDAIPTPGSKPVYPQAWNTSTGYEIADLCQGTKTTLTGAGKNYSVQQVFLNSTGKCGTGKFTSP